VVVVRYFSIVILLTNIFYIVDLSAITLEAGSFRNDQERERFQTLTEKLRCPKCKDRNLAESNAPIAKDLRNQVFIMIQQGKSDTEIVSFMVDRYGDFILHEPALSYLEILALITLSGLFIYFCQLFIRSRQDKKNNGLLD
jgi:cytochrome c-type biogenesis protein CcmH